MPVTPDARERAELCDLFTELGPDAPTLCGEWTTFDLATHLVIRERNPIAAPGILFGGQAERATDWAMARERTKGYARVIDRVRGGPPLPFRVPVLRTWLNLNEFFVHHEDVRRANGMGPRVDRPDLEAALRSVVSTMAGVQLWRRRLDAELIDHTGSSLARRGEDPPRIVGRPGELLLWLNGRAEDADVAFEGSEDQISRLWDADLGI